MDKEQLTGPFTVARAGSSIVREVHVWVHNHWHQTKHDLSIKATRAIQRDGVLTSIETQMYHHKSLHNAPTGLEIEALFVMTNHVVVFLRQFLNIAKNKWKSGLAITLIEFLLAVHSRDEASQGKCRQKIDPVK